MARVGFIGLGHMGRPMASNLARRGFEVIANDVSPEAVEGFATGTPEEIAGSSDVVPS